MGLRTISVLAVTLAINVVSPGITVGAAHADSIDDLVTRFYSDVLDRAPDPDGFAAWGTFLRANCNTFGFETLARNFFGSEEFVQTKRLTLEGLVTKFYLALLDRPPEPEGLAAWVDVLRQARVAIAVAGFIPSAEFQAHVIDPRFIPNDVLIRFYTVATLLPLNPVEIKLLSSLSTEQVARHFLGTQPFESRALTFSEYIAILYQTFLNREPDPAGLDAWVGLLTEAMLEVINAGFLPSPEFQSLSAALCRT